MTKQDIARIPEEYGVEINVCGRTTLLDVRDILSLEIEKMIEPEVVYLKIRAKCRVPEFQNHTGVVHQIRTKDNILDILSQILSKVSSFTWKPAN